MHFSDKIILLDGITITSSQKYYFWLLGKENKSGHQKKEHQKEHQKVVFVHTLDHLLSFIASIFPTNHKSEGLDIL